MAIIFQDVPRGTIVRLASGGPKMVVIAQETIRDDVWIETIWFDGSTPTTAKFPLFAVDFDPQAPTIDQPKNDEA